MHCTYCIFLLSIGFNCALGADAMRPHVKTIADVADTFVSAHPNAGLPNAFGEYDETAEGLFRKPSFENDLSAPSLDDEIPVFTYEELKEKIQKSGDEEQLG